MQTSLDKVDVLVTGATGLLGRWLVPELTRGGRTVAAVLRNAAGRDAEYREWVAALGGDPGRLHLVEGDLDAPRFGWAAGDEARLAGVRDVYHLGARFAWNLSPEAARRTNVEGTVGLIELASRLPALRRLVLIGGYRIGQRYDAAGALVDAPGPGEGRTGVYEASKLSAHRAAVEAAARLKVPTTTVHLSSVVGDSRTGATVQVLGLGELLKQVSDGKMPVLLGSAETWLPVIPVDFVARFLAGVVERPEAAGREYTLLDPATPSLHDIVRWAAGRAGRRAPRLAVPVSWVRWLPERLLGAPPETLEFLDTARYPVEPALELAGKMGLTLPPVWDVLERWLAHLRASDFAPGTRPLPCAA
ncbi:SDR family oxidoreductase [Myxococcaceae bacterium GXIMD 01537]